MKFNHNRDLEDFREDIEIIKNAGFKPIAVSQMYLEDTFVFETSDEAYKAYKTLEECSDTQVVGWWYGKKDFEGAVKEYEVENDGASKVRVHWLDEEDDGYIEDCPNCGSEMVGYDGTGDVPFLECFQCDHNWIP